MKWISNLTKFWYAQNKSCTTFVPSLNLHQWRYMSHSSNIIKCCIFYFVTSFCSSICIHGIINLLYRCHILLVILKVNKIFLGLTKVLVISTSMLFSSFANLPTCGWPVKISVKSWLWDLQSNFKMHHSVPFTSFPRSLNRQSHFLLPLSVTSKSYLYRMYLPHLSQSNKTYVFISRWPFAVYDFNIFIQSKIYKLYFKLFNLKEY